MRHHARALPDPTQLGWTSGSLSELREFEEGVRERALASELARAQQPPPRSKVLRVVTKQSYSFELNVGSGASVPLTDIVSSVGYRTGVMQLRVHSVASMPGDCELTIFVQDAARDPRAPSVLLVNPNPITSLSIVGTTVAPALKVDVIGFRLPPSFRVILEALQTDPGVIAATLGVDIVLRR